jgi:hypothetical protein
LGLWGWCGLRGGAWRGRTGWRHGHGLALGGCGEKDYGGNWKTESSWRHSEAPRV